MPASRSAFVLVTTLFAVPAAAAPELVASKQEGAERIALDATHVYWRAGGQVVRVAKSGGKPVQLAAAADVGGIAVDAKHVYFTDAATGTINRVPVAGGTAAVIAKDQKYAAGIALDAGHVYWTTEAEAGTVARVAKAGGKVTVLATKQNKPRAIAVDDKRVYWCAYWAAVAAVPVAGGEVAILADEQPTATGLALDASTVYFTVKNHGIVRSVPKRGGAAPRDLAHDKAGSKPVELVHDGANLYFIDRKRGAAIMRLRPGGTAEVFVAGGARSLAVDATHVYWTAQDDSVMRQAK